MNLAGRCLHPAEPGGSFLITIVFQHRKTAQERKSKMKKPYFWKARKAWYINQPNGGALRFEGLQDPPVPVDRIDGLTLKVLDHDSSNEIDESLEF